MKVKIEKKFFFIKNYSYKEKIIFKLYMNRKKRNKIMHYPGLNLFEWVSAGDQINQVIIYKQGLKYGILYDIFWEVWNVECVI